MNECFMAHKYNKYGLFSTINGKYKVCHLLRVVNIDDDHELSCFLLVMATTCAALGGS